MEPTRHESMLLTMQEHALPLYLASIQQQQTTKKTDLGPGLLISADAALDLQRELAGVVARVGEAIEREPARPTLV